MSTTTDGNAPQKILDRIKAMLAKAEATPYPDEAEAFSAKAFEMAEKYRVDVAALTGHAEPGMVRHTVVLADQKYLRPTFNLLVVVATHYGLLVLRPSTGNTKYPVLVGDPGDITVALLMFTSLVLQRDGAMLTSPTPAGVSTTKHRHSFGYGYAYRISDRLAAIRAAAKRAATADGNTGALEVYDRGERVRQMLADSIGIDVDKLKNASGHNRPGIVAASAAEGDEAARRADLGGHRVGNPTAPAAIGCGR